MSEVYLKEVFKTKKEVDLQFQCHDCDCDCRVRATKKEDCLLVIIGL